MNIYCGYPRIFRWQAHRRLDIAHRQRKRSDLRVLILHLLDFATDVLMIVMTTVILFSINSWLAVVTLAPLPFIAWMIHVVRDNYEPALSESIRVWSEVTNVLADTIPGIRVVKAFAQEHRRATRFREANKHNLAINDRLTRSGRCFHLAYLCLPRWRAGGLGLRHLARVAWPHHCWAC